MASHWHGMDSHSSSDERESWSRLAGGSGGFLTACHPTATMQWPVERRTSTGSGRSVDRFTTAVRSLSLSLSLRVAGGADRGWSKRRPSTAANASGRCSRENRVETVAHQSDTDCLVLDPLDGADKQNISHLSARFPAFFLRPLSISCAVRRCPKWPPSAASTMGTWRTFPACCCDVTAQSCDNRPGCGRRCERLVQAAPPVRKQSVRFRSAERWTNVSRRPLPCRHWPEPALFISLKYRRNKCEKWPS